MFRRALNLILAIAGGLNLSHGSDSIRQAILSALKAMAAAAALTPAIWDDLLPKLAIAFVESDAWDLILGRIVALVPVAPAAESNSLAIPADEVALREAFERTTANVA
jgi:hypothetical protein